jgi:LmbE family N-acetylglucosaminyl deacetylase
MDIKKIERALVFAAYPVDEILGVGGTIARLSKDGTKVTAAIFSLQETSHLNEEEKENVMEMRKKEVRTAAGILGVQESIFLKIPPANAVNEPGIYQQCIQLIRKCRPQIVFTHSEGCKNRNRRKATEIVEESCLKAGENILPESGKPWFTPYLYYYELPELLMHPSDIVDITSTIESKIKAIKTQNSYFGTLQETTEYIQALARVRGHAVGIEFGEAFALSSLTPCKH